MADRNAFNMADVKVNLDAESIILKVLQTHPEGIDDHLLSLELKGIDEQTKINGLNRLIDKNRVVLMQSSKGLPIYKFQSEE